MPVVLPEPQALRPRLLTAPGRARAILLPFPEGVGAAVFRRGEAILTVFDAAAPLDLSGLRGDSVFGGVEAWTSPEATLLRVPLAAPAALRPWREARGWVLEAVPDASRPVHSDAAGEEGAARALQVEAEPSPAARLLLRAARPGRALTIPDPETGSVLLVATMLEEGQGLALPRRLPELELLPSALGVAVLPRADHIVLRALSDRFVLQAAAGGSLILGAMEGQGAPPEAAAMSRLMNLPAGPTEVLLERLRLQQAALATAPPLGRHAARRDAAETLLALGMPQEAQAMSALALREDPRAEADPRLKLVQAAAALLSGRVEEARALDDPQFQASDETSLWSGLLAAARGDATGSAPVLAAALLLVLAYPEAMRERLLPVLAEALIEGGALAAARRAISAAPEAEALGFAHARLAELEGRAEEALQGYDAVVRGRDRRRRARALRRGIEVRLSTGQLDAAAAAAALDAALYAWRGDAEEVSARLRLAELRGVAGDARGAFEVLRETERLFPDQAAAIRPLLSDAFATAVETDSPIAAVALFDAHTDLLPPGARGERAVATLAERLVALDLPDRAATLLRQAAERTGDTAMRAALGLRRARLRLDQGDAAAALAALEEGGDAAAMPPALLLERGLLRAHALVRRGERAAGEAVLRGLGPPGAAALADLRSDSQDWGGAAAALSEHLEQALPSAPAPLSIEHRRALARLAAFAALAGDEARLASLAERHGARMADGPLAEAFSVLTADPLRGLADLPRLQRELELLRAMPARLEAHWAGAPLAR